MIIFRQKGGKPFFFPNLYTREFDKILEGTILTKLIHWTLKEFLDKTNSATATPGGGSVAAISAALGAGLAGMMAQLSVGRTNCPEQEEIQKISGQIDRLIAQLAEEAEMDILVFDEVMKAYQAPKETDSDKKERTAKIQESLKTAALVPLETGEICLQIVQLAEKIARIGNQNALSDGIAGGLLAEAALQAVLLNVRINLELIKDQEWKTKPQLEMKRISAEGTEARGRLLKL